MKIRISSDILNRELFKLQGVVSQRSTLAILSNALFEAEGNTLTLHATDLELSVSTSCECEVLEPGRVTLQAKSLFEIVKSLEEEELELETEENHWAQLRSGNVSCRIVGTHPDDFPQVLDISEMEMFPVKSEVLMDMVQKTIFSVSTDDARPNLTGAFFRLTDENAILMVSTDGHRLSKVESEAIFETKGATSDQLKDGIIIPRKGLSELKRTVDAKSEELSFGLKQNNLVFQNGPMSLAIRLIDGTFPNFTQILPKESDNKSIIPKEILQQALKFVSLFSSPKTNNVRLSLSENALELYATDPDKGEGLKTLPVSYSGAAVKAGYNHRYLSEVLSAIDGDEVSIEIIDTLSPTLIRDTERDEALYVVMPMRL